jgi:hypothetical protein
MTNRVKVAPEPQVEIPLDDLGRKKVEIPAGLAGSIQRGGGIRGAGSGPGANPTSALSVCFPTEDEHELWMAEFRRRDVSG